MIHCFSCLEDSLHTATSKVLMLIDSKSLSPLFPMWLYPLLITQKEKA